MTAGSERSYVRHEQAAVGAADGFARTTGRLGVCLTSTGPGAANAMGGPARGRASSSSPVLHLTGQIDSRFLGQRSGFIHEVPDQLAMLASLSQVCLQAESSAESCQRSVGRAAAEAMTCPRGPVSVEIPIDFQYRCPRTRGQRRRSGSPRRRAPSSPRRAAGQRRIARAAELIARVPTAARLGGRRRHRRQVPATRWRRWSAALGAGVTDEPERTGHRLRGRSLLHRQPLLGPGRPRALCREADLLVAIGTRFQGPNTENWTMELPGHLVHIDVDPGVPGRNYPVEVVIVADAKTATAAILAELRQSLSARLRGPRTGLDRACGRGGRRRPGSAFAPRSGRK